MPKIAHISDIHFGKNFDVEVWKNVRKRIEEFNPDLLVVSGDLVDHPWPFPMLAVKVELLACARAAPRNRSCSLSRAITTCAYGGTSACA